MKLTILKKTILFAILTTWLSSQNISAVLYRVSVLNVDYRINTDTRLATVVGLSDPNDDRTTVELVSGVNYSSIRYTVSYIAENAFAGNENITTVTGGEYIHTIGENAFKGCTNLESFISTIEYTHNFSSIGDSAFEGCGKLTGGFFLPTNLTNIGQRAFYGCRSLSLELDLPSTIKSIGDYAFYDCSSITGEINIPESFTSIGNYVFYNCEGLTSLTLPSTITSIGEYAFYNCSGLKGVLSIPNAITSIGGFAFQGCTGFNGILRIPESLETIDEFTFSYCTALESVDFSGCSKLLSIGNYAFNECVSLTSVDFSGCTSLQSIGDGSFFECSSVTSLDLSDCTSLQTIGTLAFQRWHALSNIDLSGCINLQSLGDMAFGVNHALTIIDLSECTSLQSIGQYAFWKDDYLTTLKFPESLKSIGARAMVYDDVLETVYCYAVNPPEVTFGDGKDLIDIFTEPMTTTGTLWVPAGSVEAYRNDPYWGQAKYINPITPELEDLEFEFDEEVMGGVEGITLEVGQTYQFVLKPSPEGAALPEITWTSSDDNIAYVSPEGEVEALAIGVAEITASATVNAQDLSATCTVTVVSAPVESLKLSMNEAEMTEGEAIQLYVTFEPDYAVPSLTWSVDDDSVLALESLDEAEYTVNGLKPGKATVTVTSNDRLGHSDTCEVTVVEDMSGIGSIFSDNNEADIEVYDLAGRPIPNSTFLTPNSLNPGIYIIRKGAETRKVLVR